MRVNAQLIDARSNRQLWGETYDRGLADVFAIRSEIAKAVADQLQAKLSPSEKAAIERPPTGDIVAFDLYTRGKNLLLTTTFSSSAGANLLQAADLLEMPLRTWTDVPDSKLRFVQFPRLGIELVRIHFALARRARRAALGVEHAPAQLNRAGARRDAA